MSNFEIFIIVVVELIVAVVSVAIIAEGLHFFYRIKQKRDLNRKG